MAQQSRGAADLATTRQRLRVLVTPLVDGAGLDLEDLSVSRAGRRILVRVVVDCDGGVTHDELSDVARDISARLDQAETDGDEISSDAYTLEVTSPGVDRPLTEPRHWRRNTGRLVTVRVGDKQRTARVVEVGEEGVTLGKDEHRETVPFAQLGPGRVQVEFGRPDGDDPAPDSTRLDLEDEA